MLPMGNSMVLEAVNFINTPEITENRIAACFLTGGGLVLKEHKKNTNRITYRTYQSPEFDRVFGLVVQNQLKTAGFEDDAAESVKFTPLDCRKSVVLHYGSLIDITLGTFVLEGEKNALQYLYNAGMGSRNGFGFGLFDVFSQIEEI
ncbi:MAG: hypothetical protein LUH47_02310 [Clostridiales bacterium]|nr:hypothetical protein [Clostridiales bacterium]